MANQGPQPKMPNPVWNSALVADSTVGGGFGLERILAKGLDPSGH